MEKENPFLKEENYYQGYQESIDNLKNKPNAIELEKLCYFVFSTEDGKKFLHEVTERFIIPGFIHPHADNIQMAAIYYEGFKEAFRMIRNCIRSHEQRIKSETEKVMENK